MIKELLNTGQRNAQTARELAAAIKADVRDVTKQIERERRDGAAICATSDGSNPGYYLAETPEELETYCKRLRKRAGEIFKTRRRLLQTLEEMRSI